MPDTETDDCEPQLGVSSDAALSCRGQSPKEIREQPGSPGGFASHAGQAFSRIRVQAPVTGPTDPG
jgi:hypothetical protein